MLFLNWSRGLSGVVQRERVRGELEELGPGKMQKLSGCVIRELGEVGPFEPSLSRRPRRSRLRSGPREVVTYTVQTADCMSGSGCDVVYVLFFSLACLS